MFSSLALPAHLNVYATDITVAPQCLCSRSRGATAEVRVLAHCSAPQRVCDRHHRRASQDATAASLPFSTLTDNFEQPAVGQLTDSPADTDRNGEVQSDTATALDATAALPSAGSPADNRDIAMAPSVAELTPTHHGVSDSAQLAFSKFEVGKVRDYTTAGGLLDSAITARVRRRF